MLSWQRAVPTAASVGMLAADHYGLSVRSCVLLRSLANDVYEIGTDTGRYAFKLYHHGGWSPGEIAWEQEFVAHVRAQGIPCAAPVPLADGTVCGVAEAPEGTRPFALTAFVEGFKPRPPVTGDLYSDFGRLVGRFHAAAAGFSSSWPRRDFDLDEVLERPLAAILPLLADRRTRIAELAAGARVRIPAAAPEWGIRHGDVSLDNIHCTAGGLVLHDFDLTAPGWLAADLTGVRATAHWDAFTAGYEQVRPLPDPAVLPWMQVCELIGNLHFHLVDKPAYRGIESRAEGWADRELASLDALYEQLLAD